MCCLEICWWCQTPWSVLTKPSWYQSLHLYFNAVKKMTNEALAPVTVLQWRSTLWNNGKKNLHSREINQQQTYVCMYVSWLESFIWSNEPGVQGRVHSTGGPIARFVFLYRNYNNKIMYNKAVEVKRICPLAAFPASLCFPPTIIPQIVTPV